MATLRRRINIRLFHAIAANYRSNIPTLLKSAALAGLLLLIISGLSLYTHNYSWLGVLGIVFAICIIVPYFMIMPMFKTYHDLRYHVRDAIVHNVSWRGDELVLDVGTGSGLTLFGCAEQLTSGKAIGIDLFLDHAGGGTQATFWENARYEGLADRVELRVADARQMPFESEMFDVIVSTGAMHHIGDASERRKTAQEIIRVLKPNGHILVFDHARILQELKQEMEASAFSGIEERGGESALLMGNKPE